MIKINTSFIKTALGPLKISENNGKLISLSFCDDKDFEKYKNTEEVCDFCGKVARQIDEYIQGKRRVFDIPIEFFATPFREAVWRELLAIPYGETATYSEIAERISKPKSQRAVGMACNKNPIAIIVPCHRVVGKGGGLTGYAYGTDIKAKLLEIEKNSKQKNFKS